MNTDSTTPRTHPLLVMTISAFVIGLLIYCGSMRSASNRHDASDDATPDKSSAMSR